ncbi:hypothetical protein Gogos_021599 [Gossypium gossypioides]|uniref:Uncharacterized protein n=2 Tax=Gossypium gossypioides TaxID=34282 RepID=A0A7J9D7N1_GOSGO|nr:hypothetical protein [Gossypium gossypioides]
MVLSQYRYDQCVPTTAGLNRVEVSIQDPRFWKKLEEMRIKKVLDGVAELTEKVRDLEMHLRGRDEEVRRQREQHQVYVKENEGEIMRQQQQHRLDMKAREEELRIQLEKRQRERSNLFAQIQRLEADPSL